MLIFKLSSRCLTHLVRRLVNGFTQVACCAFTQVAFSTFVSVLVLIGLTSDQEDQDSIK